MSRIETQVNDNSLALQGLWVMSAMSETKEMSEAKEVSEVRPLMEFMDI
jgi:hypothetical protein